MKSTTTVLAPQRFLARTQVRKFMNRNFPATCEYIFCKTKIGGTWKFFPVITSLGSYTFFDFYRLGIEVNETIETY